MLRIFMIIALAFVILEMISIVQRLMRKKEDKVRKVWEISLTQHKTAAEWWDTLSQEEKESLLKSTKMGWWFNLSAAQKILLYLACGAILIPLMLTANYKFQHGNFIPSVITLALDILFLLLLIYSETLGREINQDVISAHVITNLYVREKTRQKEEDRAQ